MKRAIASEPNVGMKTEAIVLRSIRYGEADRVLHLYSATRGRIGAIAKGSRRPRSRFGGRLEPFFRLRLVLHPGRGDLHTVSSAETVAAYPRLRENAAALDAAARACDAVARMFDVGDPHPGVFHLLANELVLLDAVVGDHGKDAAAVQVGGHGCLLIVAVARRSHATASRGAPAHRVRRSG